MDTKLKDVHSGHKGAITRLWKNFGEIRDLSEIEIEDVTAILDSVLQKRDILKDLNDKIVEASSDEDVVDKIQQTDEYMFDLDSKIRQIRKLINPSQSKSQNLPVNTTVFQASHVTPSDTPMHTLISPTANSVPASDSSQLNPHANCFTSTSHVQSNAASFYTSNPAISEIIPATNASMHIPSLHSSSSTNNQYHKLPKLNLPTFKGNILDWQSFWDSYETSIHTNPTLSDAQKFNYFKSLLQGEAFQTISGFSMKNTNYGKAISLLQERYGQIHTIIQTYMQALLEISPPIYTLVSLRNYYDKTETYVRGLESLGQTTDTYSSLLVPIILNKLPAEIRQNLARQHGPSSWNLKDLRKSILNEIQIMEAGQNAGTYLDSIDHQFANSSISTFHTGNNSPQGNTTHNAKKSQPRNIKERPCVFCKDIHPPTYCTKVSDHKARIAIVKRDNLCLNCLGNHHANECKSKRTCRHCDKRHHSSLCNVSNHGNRETANNPDIQNNQSQNQSTSVSLINTTENKEDTHILHSSTKMRTTVLLKTDVAPVWSGSICTDTNILFDEGAQRSFLTDDLAKTLNLKTEGVEVVHLSAFGKENTSTRELRKSTVHIETGNRRKFPIKVLIVPTIAVPLQNHMRNVNRDMNYLKGLRLAHPVTKEDSFEISLLIGADYYWDFIEDEIIRGDGPTAVRSKLGYLLSGPLQSGIARSSTTAGIFNLLVSHKSEEFNLEAFWKLESIGIDSSENQEKETNYLKDYQESSIEFLGDRYSAKLPWKQDYEELPSNYDVAKRRTANVIRRIGKDATMLKKYGDIIKEQERRGFIVRVDELEPTINKVHYIPHHAVVKKDSSTTPIRMLIQDLGKI
ncbi:uncharacterized protein LOC134710772 [Mytilus trossulus]|uniref:uncharacterized protein LOC134710772 n=1 Tax=Mytilus trossulus TaxID=6551 RepID=UPI003005F7A3